MTKPESVTVGTVVERLGLGVAACAERGEAEVTGAIVGDLLSYVMANGRAGNLWITIQTHPNIVAVAALAQLSGIILAGGLEPGEDTVARAEEEGLPLLTAAETTYALAGRLYELGVR
jgi:predicted transcriptional regulator